MSAASFADYWDKQWRDLSGDEDTVANRRAIAKDAYKAGISWAFTDRDAMLDQIARLREALARIESREVASRESLLIVVSELQDIARDALIMEKGGES